MIEKAKSGEYWFYGYDHNNRLTHLEKRTTEGGSSVLSVDFKYNIFGDRIERDYDADGAGAGAAVVLKMAYEAGNAWADMDSGLTVSTRHVYDGGLDSLVARIASGSQEDWYLTDVIGSVRDIVNGSGTLIDHIDYSVFGTPTETQPGSGDRYKFTGREWETEALIQYNRARYLQNGRWMSQDPIGFAAGDSNLYRYVYNAPIRSVDPLGLLETDDNPAYLKKLQDSEKLINDYITRKVIAAKQQSNNAEEGVKALYQSLVFPTTLFETKGEKDLRNILFNANSKDKTYIIPVLFSDSRYKNVPVANKFFTTPFDKIPLMFNMPINKPNVDAIPLSPVLRIQNTVIGLDKLGHFFEQGYWYFANKELRLDPYLRGVFGLYLEGDLPALGKIEPRIIDRIKNIAAPYIPNRFKGQPGSQGWLASGVVSRADLVANEAGFQFYSSVFENWGKIDATYNFDLSQHLGKDLPLLNEYNNPNTYHPYVGPHIPK